MTNLGTIQTSMVNPPVNVVTTIVAPQISSIEVKAVSQKELRDNKKENKKDKEDNKGKKNQNQKQNIHSFDLKV